MYDIQDTLRDLKMQVKKLHVLVIVGLHSYPTTKLLLLKYHMTNKSDRILHFWA